jgi:hypothetical protein
MLLRPAGLQVCRSAGIEWGREPPHNYLQFEVFTAVNMNDIVIRNVVPCSLLHNVMSKKITLFVVTNAINSNPNCFLDFSLEITGSETSGVAVILNCAVSF